MKVFYKTLLILTVLGVGLAFFNYHRPPKNLAKIKSDFTMDANNLFSDFEKDELLANDKYLDKVIEVSGTVKEVTIENDKIISISLESEDGMFGIICQLDEHTQHPRTHFKEGEKVTLKGICTGMLMDVVLVRCVET